MKQPVRPYECTHLYSIIRFGVCVCVSAPFFFDHVNNSIRYRRDATTLRATKQKQSCARVCPSLPQISGGHHLSFPFVQFVFFFFKNKRKQKIVFYFNKQKNDLINAIYDYQQSLTPEKCTKYVENLKKVK